MLTSQKAQPSTASPASRWLGQAAAAIRDRTGGRSWRVLLELRVLEDFFGNWGGGESGILFKSILSEKTKYIRTSQ